MERKNSALIKLRILNLSKNKIENMSDKEVYDYLSKSKLTKNEVAELEGDLIVSMLDQEQIAILGDKAFLTKEEFINKYKNEDSNILEHPSEYFDEIKDLIEEELEFDSKIEKRLKEVTEEMSKHYKNTLSLFKDIKISLNIIWESKFGTCKKDEYMEEDSIEKCLEQNRMLFNFYYPSCKTVKVEFEIIEVDKENIEDTVIKVKNIKIS